jgi:hypothetical protein
MKPSIVAVIICALAFILSRCSKSEYTRLVERELAKGVRKDSLFLGLKFGTSKAEFYDRCTMLNKQHITTMGIRNSNVLYTIKDSVGVINMHFFPEFENDSIYQMPLLFTYVNWSPWNRKTHPDSLLVKVTKIFANWYGSSFIKVRRDEQNDFAYVAVDGNRRITLFTSGEMDVKGTMTNLLVENKLKKK